MIKVQRFYLELKSDPFKIIDFPKDVTVEKVKNIDLNKFFYKNIGTEHYWRDRLTWLEKDWIKYISNKVKEFFND